MLVYSLVSGEDYAVHDPRGVFASRADALRFVESQRESGLFRYVDRVGVVESKLGDEVDVYAEVEWFDESVFR
jgi:hypothetical protein